jgi:RHS repeat-associated protein
VYASMAHSPDYVIDANGVNYRVLRDQLGSPLLIVNSANAADVLLNARYSAFGRRTVTSSAAVIPTLGFAGGIYDEDTGLTRFGARDYDPVVGRWTANDPVLWAGGQANLYAYVTNEPVNFNDVNGEMPVVVPAAAACAAGACEAAASAALWTAATITAAWAGLELGDMLNDWFAKKRDIQEFERIVKEYGLSRDQRRRLHDAISKKGLDLDDFAAEAEDIVNGSRDAARRKTREAVDKAATTT